MKYIGRRLLLGLVTLWLITLLIFLATQALPGDAAVAKFGRNASPEALAAFRANFHLNDPLIKQYTEWLGNLVHGEFGLSLANATPVSTRVGERLQPSFALILFAALIGIPLGWAIGVWVATHRDGKLDRATDAGILGLAAVPEFVLGIGLIVLFATNVSHVFPATSIVDPSQSIWNQLRFVLLPAITLGLIGIPYTYRMVRASMIEALESDFVAMLRLKGVGERRIVWRHAVMNAAGPSIQATGLGLAYLAGSTVIVETVFQYPGVGLELYDSVLKRDLPVLQALVLLVAAVYIVINITADVITILVTPRLRTTLK